MPDDSPHPIGPALLARLEQHREAIATNGSIQRRRESDRHGGYRLRVRVSGLNGESRRQISIPLGTGDVVVAVQALIDSWKRQRRQQRQAEEFRQAEVRQQERTRQERRRMVLTLAGGGRRRRRRVAREYDAVCARGLPAEMAWWLSEQYRRPSPKGGRPRQRRLALPSMTGHSQTDPMHGF